MTMLTRLCFLFTLFACLGCSTLKTTEKNVTGIASIDKLSSQIEQDPRNAEALADRGFAYAMAQSKSKANADFKKALHLDPKNWRIHWSYGWALFNLSQYDEAIKEWNLSLTHDGPARWMDYAFAVAYWQKGDGLTAISYYDEAVRRNPKTFSTREALLTYTDFWVKKERDTIETVFDAWSRCQKKN